ncbi:MULTISPECIES: hypothetical protein [Bacteroidota]|jgi:glutamine amidotransferase-like uncharacterized protein|uniref:Uncharacterized protein n=2 Tax=Flectobacillus TaxID=101 RepID=A0ABT6Z1P3_9BACT|nr:MULTISPECIES: hypothetical protein [Bacteroidota]NBA78913.1 hypothetical protein [Emticicia sp. ODNR4P]MDI9857937.1 hypothetical protein [Flectobacillus roseus]MDI9875029.1 hypothetical protein [Flectobacillus rivi]MDI9882440.1 hypothetical protein [Flectobacillus longus]NBA78920.1 hypothetical protein [Emticicia sp. ODNR4P]
MFNKLLKLGSFFVGLCIAGFYVSGMMLNFIQLRKEKELRKINKYE